MWDLSLENFDYKLFVLSILLFKEFFLFWILNFDAQNTLRFIYF